MACFVPAMAALVRTQSQLESVLCRAMASSVYPSAYRFQTLTQTLGMTLAPPAMMPLAPLASVWMVKSHIPPMAMYPEPSDQGVLAIVARATRVSFPVLPHVNLVPMLLGCLASLISRSESMSIPDTAPGLLYRISGR